MSDTHKCYCAVCSKWQWFYKVEASKYYECEACQLLVSVGVKADLTKVE